MTLIEAYILDQKAELRPLLTAVYHELQTQLPDAQEKISYGMPTFWQGRNIIHFATQKEHLGIYPGPAVIEDFSEQLDSLGLTYSKGAIQFPYDKELPLELIAALAKRALELNKK